MTDTAQRDTVPGGGEDGAVGDHDVTRWIVRARAWMVRSAREHAAAAQALPDSPGDVHRDLAGEAAAILRATPTPPETVEGDREGAVRDPAHHAFTQPSGDYCAICGYDREAHNETDDHGGCICAGGWGLNLSCPVHAPSPEGQEDGRMYEDEDEILDRIKREVRRHFLGREDGRHE